MGEFYILLDKMGLDEMALAPNDYYIITLPTRLNKSVSKKL